MLSLSLVVMLWDISSNSTLFTLHLLPTQSDLQTGYSCFTVSQMLRERRISSSQMLTGTGVVHPPQKKSILKTQTVKAETCWPVNWENTWSALAGEPLGPNTSLPWSSPNSLANKAYPKMSTSDRLPRTNGHFWVVFCRIVQERCCSSAREKLLCHNGVIMALYQGACEVPFFEGEPWEAKLSKVVLHHVSIFVFAPPPLLGLTFEPLSASRSGMLRLLHARPDDGRRHVQLRLPPPAPERRLFRHGKRMLP